jgi:hypothetical protein
MTIGLPAVKGGMNSQPAYLGESWPTETFSGETAREMRTNRKGRMLSLIVLISLALAGCGGGGAGSSSTTAPAGHASAGHPNGVWSTLPYSMPINPIHAALLHDGKVLVVQGSGNDGTVTDFQAAVWNLQDGTVHVIHNLSWDMFCNGMSVLPDGRVLISGGTLKYSQMQHMVGDTLADDPFLGLPNASIFDPATEAFTDVPPSAHGRWYPTTLELNDGRILTFSGLDENGNTNQSLEIYTANGNSATKSDEYVSPWAPPLYPRMHLLPSGQIFYSASTSDSHLFDPSTNSWVSNPRLEGTPGTPPSTVAWTIYGGGDEERTYGSSVLLPLTPANHYSPKVMILGGDNPATDTTEVIDLGQPMSEWEWTAGPKMSQPRVEMEATLLPSGEVLVYAGSAEDENASTASLKADLYDPATNSFSSAGANTVTRLYHNVGLLMPDATVVLAGGNPAQGTYENRIERYQPAYLFNADGSLATRPTIGNSLPGTIPYGTAFNLATPDAANISSVVLMKAGSVTHSFDMDQRFVGLSFTGATSGSGSLTVTAPTNSNIAPPGYYMLFLVNSAGVPSVASFVQIIGAPAPPVAALRYRPLVAAPAYTPSRPRKVTEAPLPLRKRK